MAENIDKQTLTRLAWTTELRRQGHRKCIGEFQDGTNVCAIGLLGEVAGIRHEDLDFMEATDVGRLVGISNWQVQEIVARNDGTRALGDKRKYHKHTFAEIADVVDGWFKP